MRRIVCVLAVAAACGGEPDDSQLSDLAIEVAMLAERLALVDGRALITLSLPSDSPPDLIRATADSVAARHGLQIETAFTIVPVLVATVPESAIASLMADSLVERIEPDYVVTTSGDSTP